MIHVKRAIFPAVLAGCILIFLLSGIIEAPETVLASEGSNNQMDGDPPVVFRMLDILTTQNPGDESLPFATGSEAGMEAAAVNEEISNHISADESLAIETGGCTLSEGFPEEIRQFCEEIEIAASENALDPNLVAAVILQESRGDVNAYSHSGAVGLMQVMPRDGLAAGYTCINGPCFANRPTTNELFDPSFNIKYGTGMLAGLINRNGSVREGLRAYGPGDSGYYYADLVVSIYNGYR